MDSSAIVNYSSQEDIVNLGFKSVLQVYIRTQELVLQVYIRTQELVLQVYIRLKSQYSRYILGKY